MARVKGPLMSAEASGNTTGAALQFRTAGGQTHVYRPPVPGSQNQAPPSPEQEAVRLRFKSICNEWVMLPQGEKATWNEKAWPRGISGYSLFIQDRMKQGVMP